MTPEVSILAINSASIIIDSDPKFNQNPVERITKIGSLAKTVRRLSPYIFTFTETIPNITSKNNLLSFEYDGVLKVADIPIGFLKYNPENIVGTIIHFMEVAAGVAPGTFTITPLYDGLPSENFSTGTITTPLDIKIIDNTFSRRHRWLWNPEFQSVASTSFIYGPVIGVYSRYFDLVSFSLTEDTKLPSASTDDGKSNTVRRFYVSNTPAKDFGRLAVVELINLTAINVRADKEIGTIDYRLVDEYNEILEVFPTNGDPDLNRNPFAFVFELKAEL